MSRRRTRELRVGIRLSAGLFPIFVLTMGMAGCARMQESLIQSKLSEAFPQSSPVNIQDGQRIDLGRYSVLPPKGGRWIARRDSSAIMFFDIGPKADLSSLFAVASTPKDFPAVIAKLGSPEQLKMMQIGLRPQDMGPYFSAIREEFRREVLAGAECLRFDLIYEDRRFAAPENQASIPPNLESFRGKVPITTQHGYRCYSPTEPRIGVQIMWSQRALTESELPSFPGGEDFLRSLQFAPSTK